MGSNSKGNKIDKCKKDLFKKITAPVSVGGSRASHLDQIVSGF